MLQHIFFNDLLNLLLGFLLLPLFVVHLVNYQLVVFGFNPEWCHIYIDLSRFSFYDLVYSASFSTMSSGTAVLQTFDSCRSWLSILGIRYLSSAQSWSCSRSDENSSDWTNFCPWTARALIFIAFGARPLPFSPPWPAVISKSLSKTKHFWTWNCLSEVSFTTLYDFWMLKIPHDHSLSSHEAIHSSSPIPRTRLPPSPLRYCLPPRRRSQRAWSCDLLVFFWGLLGMVNFYMICSKSLFLSGCWLVWLKWRVRRRVGMLRFEVTLNASKAPLAFHILIIIKKC